jgi:septum formation protein
LLGLPFRVVVSDVPEGADPLANARAKARAVAEREGVPRGGAVLGGDTEVLLDGRALGKPADVADARRMLTALSGRSHVVETAMVLVTAAGEHEVRDRATVHVRPASDAGGAVLDWYLATGEWRDRAGAYAVQGAGAVLVERIEGHPSTVIGLSLPALTAMLQEAGLAPWGAAPPYSADDPGPEGDT